MNRSKDRQTLSGKTGAHLLFVCITILSLTACSTAPVELHPYQKTTTIPATPEQSRRILETIEKTHPGIHIEASLTPVGMATNAKITVRTSHKEHLVNKGFQKIEGKTEIYPACQHWFFITRNFDPACGGGKLWGTASAIFVDGGGIGALFDLVQLGRYPFTWTKTDLSSPQMTNEVSDLAKKMAMSAKEKNPLSAPK